MSSGNTTSSRARRNPPRSTRREGPSDIGPHMALVREAVKGSVEVFARSVCPLVQDEYVTTSFTVTSLTSTAGSQRRRRASTFSRSVRTWRRCAPRSPLTPPALQDLTNLYSDYALAEMEKLYHQLADDRARFVLYETNQKADFGPDAPYYERQFPDDSDSSSSDDSDSDGENLSDTEEADNAELDEEEEEEETCDGKCNECKKILSEEAES